MFCRSGSVTRDAGTEMLEQLQQRLHDIYRVDGGYDVRDFLITDPALAQRLGAKALPAGTEETLLMAERDDELAVSLFLSASLLARLEQNDPLARLEATMLSDLWKVVEGLSHFTCVVWKASQGRAVSLLELELQAEIDKFVSTAQLASEQGESELSRNLHRWLFDEVRFRDDLDAEQRDRYRCANDFAARYCLGLIDAVACREGAAIDELRRFYRLPMAEKVSHIRSRAFKARHGLP
jgi:hypothetical protein